MKISTFILINFIVAFLSDITLNDLSRAPLSNSHNLDTIKTLKIYFENKSILWAGVLAGLTIIFALVLLIVINKLLFKYWIPENWLDLLKFCILAFFIGYIVDIIIDKLNIFGNTLKPFYKKAGSGFWGAFAFVFSIVISFIIQKYLLPIL